MKRAGYRGEESAAIVAAASAMGILVPPCILMVILAAIANISVIALFVAGFIPAFVLAAGLFGVVWYKARKEGWPRGPRSSWSERLRAGRDAVIPLLSPVIIFGGILSGAVTVTEAAVLAVIYALFVGVFIYRELTFRKIYQLFAVSSSMTSMAFWLIGTASVFAWILTIEQAPAHLGGLVAGAPGGTATFLLFSILVFVVLGGILDGMPALLILGPVFFPIATSLGKEHRPEDRRRQCPVENTPKHDKDENAEQRLPCPPGAPADPAVGGACSMVRIHANTNAARSARTPYSSCCSRQRAGNSAERQFPVDEDADNGSSSRMVIPTG